MNIGITGQNGFLGKHLISRFREDKISYSVCDREKYNLLNPQSLKDFVRSVDVIIHLAGVNRDTNFTILNGNVMGTAGLMEAISLYNPKAKVIISSSYQAFTQDNIYGVSKKLAEDVVEKYARIFSIPSISLRISNIFGPDCKPYYNSVIATFVDQIQQNKPLSINGDGSQERDFIYVSDVVDAILQAVWYKQDDLYENFTICSGKTYSLNDIIRELQHITKQDIVVNYNKDGQTGAKEIVISNHTAKTRLDWEPKVSLREGLEKILDKKH